MANISEVRIATVEFLKASLGVSDVEVIKVAKLPDGWEAAAEVYEVNGFLKSLGLPTRVQDRNIYEVKLDRNLEVQSYEREGVATH